MSSQRHCQEGLIGRALTQGPTQSMIPSLSFFGCETHHFPTKFLANNRDLRWIDLSAATVVVMQSANQRVW
jgi:hypothetical protein